MAGRIDYYFLPLAAAASALTSGKLTVPAVSTAKRAALSPDVPTVAEAGYPAAESDFWVGLSAPAKTPDFIVNKLHDATEQVLQTPAVNNKLAKLGVDPQPMSVAKDANASDWLFSGCNPQPKTKSVPYGDVSDVNQRLRSE